MNAKIRRQATLVVMALAVAVHLDAKASGDRQAVNSPGIGPRGTIGPDTPLNDAEKTRFKRRTTVERRSAAAVRTACENAVKDGLAIVFLPAGEYVFEKTVGVPAGLTLLGEGSRTLVCTGGVGRYVHKPGVRKTHWEFVHNRVGSNDKSPHELCAVDTHPGMDGTFVVASNLFENLRHGVGIRDGSGRIRGNVFRNLRTVTNFRSLTAISISSGKHNNIPVEECMPRDIQVEDNVFVMDEGVKYEACRVGKAENIVVDGELVPETEIERPTPRPLPRLVPMDTDGKITGTGEADQSEDKGAEAQ